MSAKRARKDPFDELSKPELFCNRSELDFFVVPKEQDPVLSSHEVTHTPIGSLDNRGPINFSIDAVDEYFTDLSKTKLMFKVKITKNDGTDLQSWAEIQGREAGGNGTARAPDVSIPNDFHSCLVRRCGLEINCKPTPFLF